MRSLNNMSNIKSLKRGEIVEYLQETLDAARAGKIHEVLICYRDIEAKQTIRCVSSCDNSTNTAGMLFELAVVRVRSDNE